MSLSNILVPNAGCLFGNYPGTTCDSSSTDGGVLFRNFETLINRTAATNGLLNIVHFYHDWNDFTSSFPTANEDALAAEGRLLFVNWTPRIYGSTTQFNWADITAGTYDATYIDPTARHMRDWGGKFFIAFHTEMNSGSSAQGGTYGTDAEYAAAAQHVHDRFVAQGCSNAVWVFNPSGYTSLFPTRMNALYPGDAYVDWIGWDPYSGGASGGWEDVDYVLTTKWPMYNWATSTKSGSHTKPMMWCEWGAEEAGGVPGGGTYPNTKAGYFDQVAGKAGSGYAGIKSTFPLVKAIVYFNSTTSTGDCVNTSSQALAAFRNLAADPYFRPDLQATPPPPAGTIGLRGTGSAAINKAKSVGLVVPAAAQAGDGLAVLLGVTRSSFRAACEGTNGANVTTGNSNSAGSNPADVITTTAPVYDTSQKHSGTSSIHASLVAGTDCHQDWTTSFGWPTAPNTSYYGRAYIRRSAAPPAICRFYDQNSSANALQCGLGLDTSGNLIVRNTTGGSTVLTVSGGALATATWHRVEWKATWTGTQTTVQVRLFRGTNADGITPDQDETSTAFAQAAAPGRGKFGLIFTAANTYDVHLDDFDVDTSGWLGPAASTATITVPASLVTIGSDDNTFGPSVLQTRVYRKTVGAGDPGSTVTITTDNEVHGSALLVCWSGTDPAALEDVLAVAQRQSNGTTVTSPNATTTVAGDLVVTAYFDRAQAGTAATSSWTPPTGDTLRASSYGTGTDGRVSGGVSDDGVGHTVGTYGSKVATANATSYLATAWTLAVRPATAAGDTQSVGMVGIPS